MPEWKTGGTQTWNANRTIVAFRQVESDYTTARYNNIDDKLKVEVYQARRQDWDYLVGLMKLGGTSYNRIDLVTKERILQFLSGRRRRLTDIEKSGRRRLTDLEKRFSMEQLAKM